MRMSVLWLELGYTRKYSLSPWEIPLAPPSGFPLGSGYIYPPLITIQIQYQLRSTKLKQNQIIKNKQCNLHTQPAKMLSEGKSANQRNRKKMPISCIMFTTANGPEHSHIVHTHSWSHCCSHLHTHSWTIYNPYIPQYIYVNNKGEL